MESSKTVSIVVPCYNEEAGLEELHRRVVETCKQLSGWDHEFILVDDGSADDTRSIIQALSRLNEKVVGVFLSRNHGHQLALTAGLSVAKGDRVFILDADLQDPPELLHDMMEVMDEGADVVYGQRRKRNGETAFKKVSAWMFYRALNFLSEVEIPRDTGDFRLMSRKALDELNNMNERYRFIRGLVSWIGLRQEPFLYDRDERYAGDTHYPLRKMIRFSIDAVTSFSIRPLKIAIVGGFALAFLSVLCIAYVIAGTLIGKTVPGWSSIIAAILFCSSVQLIMLGIIGEYLGRLYMESKNRPLFIIEDVVGRSNAETIQDEALKPQFVA